MNIRQYPLIPSSSSSIIDFRNGLGLACGSSSFPSAITRGMTALTSPSTPRLLLGYVLSISTTRSTASSKPPFDESARRSNTHGRRAVRSSRAGSMSTMRIQLWRQPRTASVVATSVPPAVAELTTAPSHSPSTTCAESLIASRYARSLPPPPTPAAAAAAAVVAAAVAPRRRHHEAARVCLLGHAPEELQHRRPQMRIRPEHELGHVGETRRPPHVHGQSSDGHGKAGDERPARGTVLGLSPRRVSRVPDEVRQ